MNDEIKRLWDLFEALLAPNRVLNDMLDRFAQSEHRATYLSLWERLMDLETDVLKLKYELAKEQANETKSKDKDADTQNDTEGYQE